MESYITHRTTPWSEYTLCVADPGEDRMQSHCNTPDAVPCANTSPKAFGYCGNGICCYLQRLQYEFCELVSLSFVLVVHCKQGHVDSRPQFNMCVPPAG